MRQISDAVRSSLLRSHRVGVRVEAWLSGVLLGDVPVTGGTVAFDDTATMKRSATLAVPTFDGLTDWDPSLAPDAPLAAYGQRLRLMYGVGLPYGGTEWIPLGWYLITGWKRAEPTSTVEVSCIDLAQLLADARLYATEGPAAGGTYASEFRRMVDGILPVRIAPELGDGGRVQPTTVYDRDRTKNLDQLAAAWGARWFVDDLGTVAVEPAYGPVDDNTPVTIRLTSGAGGTITTRSKEGGRDRTYNAVVVTGKSPDQDTDPPYAVAEVTDDRSPIRVSGPYGRKPKFYASDTLATVAQCQAVADAMLAAATATARAEPVSTLPDPSVEMGDVAEIVTDGLPWRGRVVGISLPLGAADAMQVTVSNKPRPDDDQEGR